jgi:hypothetical protein
VSGARAALERLLADLAASERSAELIASWGDDVPSERAPSRRVIPQPVDPAFAELEVRPWEDGRTGGVEVRFAADHAPTLHELQAWVGALEETPPTPGGTFLLRGEWSRGDLPVLVVILVEEPEEPADRVPVVTLQRGRVRS